MIGSHNSYTYIKCNNWFRNLFSFLWRCQNTSILEQYQDGCRYFDIHIKLASKEHPRYKKWQVCHRKNNFNKYCQSLDELCTYFDNLNGCIFRIVLEDREDEKEFRKEIKDIINKYSTLDCIIIKDKWEVLYRNTHYLKFKNYYYIPWNNNKSLYKNLKNLLLNINLIKWYANKHNPRITLEMIEDPNIVYMMDFSSDAINR